MSFYLSGLGLLDIAIGEECYRIIVLPVLLINCRSDNICDAIKLSFLTVYTICCCGLSTLL